MITHRRVPGFMLLDSLGAIFALLMLLPVLYYWINQGLVDVEKRAVASHFNSVINAARQYGRTFSATLLSTATANSGPTLTIADLQTAGLLASFNPANAWGQGYQIYARQPSPGALRLVVMTTGGRTSTHPDFINGTVPSTAALAGGHAGFIPSGLLSGQASTQLQGAFGGWTVNLGSLNVPNPGPGHLGSLTDFSSDDLAHDFLYRVAVPGKPELNEMWTALDMRDHAIKGIKELQFVSHTLAANSCTGLENQGRVFLDDKEGLYVCRDGKAQVLSDTGNSTMFKAATVVSHGTLIDKPICPPGTNTQPEIFVAPAIASAGAKAPPIAAFQAWATSESDAQWRVQLRVLNGDGSGWVYPGANYGKVMVFTTCN